MRINIKQLSLFFTLFVATTTANCLIDYKDFPKADPLVSSKKIHDKKLVYNLPYFPAFNLGGKEAMETYFQVKTPFKNTESGVDVPNDGYFVDVKVDYRSPTTPALLFLTASTMTATILPAWSMHDGYDMRYTLWKNGKEVETFSYSVERKYGQWFPLFFVIWLNTDTATEKSVFERTTEQFFKDAERYF
ncbi:MAG: hypothetical protein JJT78_02625 [Leptospira sp.]|nr:hypothetical protein [Leptospira sp.]